ncbi:carbohydrate binding domain-containing protein [Paenibacillus chungangensis]|uniref:Carbohydrate binding domain-containing protein n=1 Tax=Paenibacillus chungangensis TaxID=696535 RepID=A0ABW3HL36_9BACL
MMTMVRKSMIYVLVGLMCIGGLSGNGSESVQAATMRYFDNVESSQFPVRLQNHLSQQPWEDGYIDITKPPYNAAGDGMQDDTAAIQAAIDDAYASNLIVYFPTGTYLVSNQIRAFQYDDNWYQGSGFGSQRKFGNLLVGETGGSRPVIKLKDNSTVTDNILLLYKWLNPNNPTQDGRPKHYLATFRGIDIDMGNNAGVSAISMDGAQYCTIQDTHIYGSDFRVGIHKIPGAVGSVINARVTGGDIGILADSYAPQPLVAGITLEGQSEYGIKITDSRQSTVNVIGFKITGPSSPSASYRGVYVERNPIVDYGKEQSSVYLQDGQIEVQGANGVAIENADNPLYDNNGSNVVINDVYIKSDVLVRSPLSDHSGNASSWKHIDDYAYSPGAYGSYIHVNGDDHSTPLNDSEYMGTIASVSPPPDLVSRHSWPIAMPSYDDADKVNIVTDYGATPYDDSDDDAVAIQQAIDDVADLNHANYGKSIFIPRGHFKVKQGLLLKKGVKIFGAGKNISVIEVDPAFTVNGPSFLLDTVNDAQADIVMTDFALLKLDASAALGQTDMKNLGFLRIRGGGTVFRDVQLAATEQVFDNFYLQPEVVFSDQAGGKIYNLAVNTSVKYTDGGNVSGDYHRVVIQNTNQPLDIYQMGVNNAEKSVLLNIDNAEHVNIYALKYEEENRLFRVEDSNDIRIIGGYGYYAIGDNHPAIIQVNNTSQLYFAGLSRLTMRHYGEYQGRSWIINGSESIPDDHTLLLYKEDNAHSASTPTDLLTNGGFESGLIGWSAEGSATITAESDNIYQLSQSAMVSNRSSSDDTISYDITSILQANGSGIYTPEAWVRNLTNIESDFELRIVITDSTGTHETKLIQGGAMYWQRIHDRLSLSWNGTLSSAKLEIVSLDPAQSYFVDYVQLYKGDYSYDQQVNLLSNPGFESGTSDWSSSGSGALTAVTSTFAEGEYAGVLNGRATPADGIEQDITAILSQEGPGEYDYSAFVKLGSGVDEKTKMKLKVTDDNGSRTYTGTFYSTDGKWTAMGGHVDLDWSGNLSSAKLTIVTDTNTSDLFVDGARLIKSGTLIAEVVTNPVVTNPGFESGDLTGWDSNNVTINTNSYVGAYAAKLDGNGELSQHIHVSPGHTYTLQAYMDVVHSKGVMEVLDGTTVIDAVEATSKSWTPYTLTVTVPTGVTQLTLRFTTASNKSVKVDDITVIRE